MRKSILLYILLLTLCCAHFVTARSAPPLPEKWAIASAHPLATQAGEKMLELGGNAFDAAIAISTTLAVVEPSGSGLGGGAFWLLQRQGETQAVMLDSREKAPLAASPDMFMDEKGQLSPKSINGPLAAGIPGTVAALLHIAKNYARLPLKTSLAPAIYHAQKGFPVTRAYQKMIRWRLKVLQSYPQSSAIFLQNNQVPEIGYLIKQVDLAHTLEQIAEKGRQGFYAGEIARKMVNSVKESGGIWSLQDLQEYSVQTRAPVVFKYQGLRIQAASLPSSGGLVLAGILHILQNLSLQDASLVQQKHLIIEAMRRAYRDRAIYMGDPDFTNPPLQQLLSPWYGAGLANSIHPDKATPSSLLPGIPTNTKGKDTSHFSVLDIEGNRVSTTQSINYPFGSGFVAKGTGILLNDEMDDFAANPGIPNAYGLVGSQANAIFPEKRPLSSMTPTFVESEQGLAIIGTPGGSRIISMVLLVILEISKNHLNPEQWVNLPRYHHQYLPDTVAFEKAALNAAERSELAQKGHKLKEVSPYGNMHAIFWNYQNGNVSAASDQRGEGLALSK